MTHELRIVDPWRTLRSATPARIALGRAGGSLATRDWLDFKQAHATARDAVHHPFDTVGLAESIRSLECDVFIVDSAAPDRETFLKRPDLGRQLDDAAQHVLHPPDERPELVIIVSDGLSAMAVERQTLPLLTLLLPKLSNDNWGLAPIVIVRFGRVAVEDVIGERLGAQIALILLGERPGLGSPDSLGAYLVYSPRPGRTDAQRNCVSNIRPEGLPHAVAADTIHYLLTESRRRRTSGVHLKDERRAAIKVAGQNTINPKELV